jgi:hypothetical protein
MKQKYSAGAVVLVQVQMSLNDSFAPLMLPLHFTLN